MAYESNGKQYSYDYSELLDELRSDLDEGILEPHNIISFVRERNFVIDDGNVRYKPIIDYYYPNAFKGDLESLYDKDEYSEEEWEEMELEYKADYAKYKEDEPYLERATALALLTEMEIWDGTG